MSETKPQSTASKHTKKTKKITHTPVVPAPAIHVKPSSGSNTANNFALAGFILSLMGMVVPGFVLSFLGIVKSKEKNGAGKGLAIAGVVLSTVWVFIWMAVIFGLLLFISTQESKQDNYSTKGSYDGAYTLSIPDSFDVQSDLNDAADIQFADDNKSIYVMTINESTQDFDDSFRVEDYADLAISSFASRVDGFNYVSADYGFSSLPVKDYEIRGSVDGVRIVYYVRLIKLEDRFVQVITWTTPSKIDDNNETMKAIVSSIKET